MDVAKFIAKEINLHLALPGLSKRNGNEILSLPHSIEIFFLRHKLPTRTVHDKEKHYKD